MNIQFSNWQLIDLNALDASLTSVVNEFDTILNSFVTADFSVDTFTNNKLTGRYGSYNFVILGANFITDVPTETYSSISLIDINDPTRQLLATGNVVYNYDFDTYSGFFNKLSYVASNINLLIEGRFNVDSFGDMVGGTASKYNISFNGNSLNITGNMTLNADNDIIGGTISSFTFIDSAGHRFAATGLALNALQFYNLTDPLAPNLHPNLDAFNNYLTDSSRLAGNDTFTPDVNDVQNNAVNGYAGNDSISGGGGNDTLFGGLGLDTLDGGDGADSLVGGDGADTYISDGNDTIAETNATAAGGIDLVKSSGTYTLSTNIENLTLTGTNNINGTGNELANIIIGNAGANTLNGEAGNDTLTSNAGDDNLNGGNGNDTLNGGEGNDTLIGGAGVDALTGGKGNDTYYIDLIRTNALATSTVALQDTVSELANIVSTNPATNMVEGIDTIVLTNNTGNAGVIGSAGAPIDTSNITVATTLIVNANVENFDASQANNADGSGIKLNITGNALANTITGNSAANILDGGLNDGKADTLTGGAGNDIYLVDMVIQASAIMGQPPTFSFIDSISELTGIDTLKLRGALNYGATYIETLSVDDGRFFGLEGLDLSLTGATRFYLNGNNTNNNLVGNVFANRIEGGGGNDTLDGGAGADILQGDIGDDTYVIDNIGDSIQEYGGDANDTIRSSIAINLNSTVSTTNQALKYDNIEDVTLTGAAAVNVTGDGRNNILNGNDGANIIDGDGTSGIVGDDIMNGGKGADTYIVNSIGDEVTEDLTIAQGGGIDLVKSKVTFILGNNVDNLTLTDADNIDGTGNALANTIIGNTGNNVITGGAGKDTLTGGKGDDTYFVDLAKIGTGATATVGLQDTITELANPATPAGNNIEGIDAITLTNLTGGTDAGGNAIALNVADFVTTSTITLGANIERINAINTAGFKLNLTGNTLNNWLDGNNMANVLLGLAGDDDIVGYAGDDTLDGGIGNDTLSGGTGNDTYIVDMLVTGTGATSNFSIIDTIEEGFDDSDTIDTSAGIDTIKLRGVINFGTASPVTLSVGDSRFASVDGIDVSLAGAAQFYLTGNSTENILIGNAYTNLINGDGGNDTLDGGAGNDTLNGGEGNDSLVGGAGVDSLDGGNGDDTYTIDVLTDIIVDSGGNDTLQAAFSLSLQNTLANAVQFNSFGLEIENLTLLGTGAINATGNGDANKLIGNDGANILDGAGGADTLIGGKGADTYIVNLFNGADSITESLTILQGGGIDLVKSNGDFTLGSNLDNLTLTDGTVTGGTVAMNATGNDLKNILIGNAGNNLLSGLDDNDTLTANAGNDTLVGGNGNDILNSGVGLDTFVFDTALNALTNKDTIQGFSHAEDTIELSQAIFGGIGIGTLNAANYRVGAAATTPDHRIINNAGNLYYDADGSGTSFAAVQFATLTGTVGIIGVDDFVIV